MMRRFTIPFVIAATLGLAGVAITQTPDRQPPSRETVCNGLKGAAFGLCNAYCEAQDCDVHQRPSCDQLRANFFKVTGNRRFPCDRVACEKSDAPACNGDCPEGTICLSGPERVILGTTPPPCECVKIRLDCGDSAPACDGECPKGTVCTSGPEKGAPVNGPVASCVCEVP